MKSMLEIIKNKIEGKFPKTCKYLLSALRYLRWNIRYFFIINIKRRHFLFRGKKLKYINHWYNSAYSNERTIEVPIIYDLVKKYRGKNILEIGNVLSHYFITDWDIVDKYEKGKRVINEDIINFVSQKRYNLVISISTFEHIGYMSEHKDDNKVMDAINHVKINLLAADGLFIITVPVDCNGVIDKKLLSEELGFDKIYYFRKISADNTWRECKKEDSLAAKYGSPYNNANAIAICATKDLDLYA